jgi:hypothetical protein
MNMSARRVWPMQARIPRQLALLALTLSPLAGAAEAMWMHGSWVNARESADAQSAVIDHVRANTPVEVVARHNDGKTCEILWGASKHGFVPCRLLGEKRLTLREAMANGMPPPRAFWIAPSVPALRDAGWFFQETLLSKEQKETENPGGDGRYSPYDDNPDLPPPKLVRYPVPEFEAMKSLLAEGVIGAAFWDVPLLSCSQIEAMEARQSDKPGNWYSWLSSITERQLRYPSHDIFIPSDDYWNRYWSFWGKQASLIRDCRGMDQSVRLPKASPSFFKSDRDILPGNAHIEQISARFGIVERGRVISGPRWVMTRSHGVDMYWRYLGAWDIGLYELELERPIVEHVIGRNGQIGAYQWTPQQVFDFDPAMEECSDEPRKWDSSSKDRLSGSLAIKEALLWFQSPTALPLQKAKVSRRVKKLEETREDGSAGQLTVYEIDVDGDGVADFVKWELEAEYNAYIVFVNINGEWHPFERNYGGPCGC